MSPKITSSFPGPFFNQVVIVTPPNSERYWAGSRETGSRDPGPPRASESARELCNSSLSIRAPAFWLDFTATPNLSLRSIKSCVIEIIFQERRPSRTI